MNQSRTIRSAANHYPRDDDLSSLLVGFYCGTLNWIKHRLHVNSSSRHDSKSANNPNMQQQINRRFKIQCISLASPTSNFFCSASVWHLWGNRQSDCNSSACDVCAASWHINNCQGKLTKHLSFGGHVNNFFVLDFFCITDFWVLTTIGSTLLRFCGSFFAGKDLLILISENVFYRKMARKEATTCLWFLIDWREVGENVWKNVFFFVIRLRDIILWW